MLASPVDVPSGLRASVPHNQAVAEDHDVPEHEDGLLDDGLSDVPGRKRIAELPMLASLYVQVLGPMGTVEGSATGFVLRDADGNPYLITNRHVVTGQNSLNGLAAPGNAPVTSALRVAMHKSGPLGTWLPVVLRLGDEEGRPYWLEHPVHGPWMDVIALPLGNFLEREGLDLITYPRVAPAARMELGTELQVIGFPVGFDPVGEDVPLGVWTRGTVAWPPSLQWRHLPAFLIDCRSRPGQSGSPVVFSASDLTSYRHASGATATGPVHEFIGVYSGRIHKDSDVGVVWKRDAVREIVEHGVQPSEPGSRPEHPWVPPLEVPLASLTEPSALSSGTTRNATGTPALQGSRDGGELTSAGGVTDRADQQTDVAVVDASDRVAEDDRDAAAEAGRQAEHPLFPTRAWEPASVQGVDGGFPVDGRCPGAGVDEPGEVVAFSDRGGC
jgi:Trypsin-like peptidase domain